MIIDLSVWDKNPLDLIGQKQFAERLKEQGADGEKIKDMLCNWHGISIKSPILKDETFKKEREKYRVLSYSIRKINTVLKDPYVSEETQTAVE